MLCGKCLNRTFDTTAARKRSTCPFCRRAIRRKPIFSFDIRDHVEGMAQDRGITIPDLHSFALNWSEYVSDEDDIYLSDEDDIYLSGDEDAHGVDTFEAVFGRRASYRN